MDSKKIIVFVVVGLLLLGILGMMSFGNGGANKENKDKQQGESRDQMMTRMHPDQQVNNGASNLDKIKFSEAVGKLAPDFTLTNQNGSKFTLSDYNKTIVLFFNEGAMCYPACWNQIALFGEDKRFNNDEVMAVSVVIDGKEKWDKIISSQPKFGAGILVFDTTKEVSQAYDVLNVPSSMHKGSNPGHTYFVIKEGVITYVLDDPKMALNNDEIASKL